MKLIGPFCENPKVSPCFLLTNSKSISVSHGSDFVSFSRKKLDFITSISEKNIQIGVPQGSAFGLKTEFTIFIVSET